MLTNNISKAVFNGNGVATQFPFSFKVWDASQLIVTIIDPHGVESVVISWSLTLTDDGGTLTYLHDGKPLEESYTLVILRNMPFTQGVDLITGTRFDPQVIETALDKATAERQQLFEAIERSVKISPASSITADELLSEIFEARAETVTNAAYASESAVSSLQSANTATEQAIRAESIASTAKQEVIAAGQEQVNEATIQANRAKVEADRAASVVGTPDGVTTIKNADDELSVKTTSFEDLSDEPTPEVLARPAPIGDVKTAKDRADQAYEKASQSVAAAYISDYYPKSEEEKAEANGNYWRKWSDGFIEQGIIINKISPSTSTSITLLTAMTTKNYLVSAVYGNWKTTAPAYAPFSKDRDFDSVIIVSPSTIPYENGRAVFVTIEGY